MVDGMNTRLFEHHPSSEHSASDVAVELGRTRGKTGLATHYNDAGNRFDGRPGTVIPSVSNVYSSVDLKNGHACLNCDMEATDPCHRFNTYGKQRQIRPYDRLLTGQAPVSAITPDTMLFLNQRSCVVTGPSNRSFK